MTREKASANDTEARRVKVRRLLWEKSEAARVKVVALPRSRRAAATLRSPHASLEIRDRAVEGNLPVTPRETDAFPEDERADCVSTQEDLDLKNAGKVRWSRSTLTRRYTSIFVKGSTSWEHSVAIVEASSQWQDKPKHD